MPINLFDSIRERTDNAHRQVMVIEEKVKAIVPTLQTLQPVLGKSATRLNAVILTLNEVASLAQAVRDEISAGEAHLTEDLSTLEELGKIISDQRHDMAHLATITRYIDFFLQDPLHFKAIMYGVIKERPDMRAMILEWLNEQETRPME